jgi:hypothetical protein
MLGEFPSRANLATSDSTSSGAYFTHEGAFLLTGLVEPERPRLLVYSRANLIQAPNCLDLAEFSI